MKIIFVIQQEPQAISAGPQLSDPDIYLAVGRAVRDCLRLGLPLQFIAQTTEMTVDECWLASKFAESSNGFKLQALVEDWSWSKIKAELIELEGLELENVIETAADVSG